MKFDIKIGALTHYIPKIFTAHSTKKAPMQLLCLHVGLFLCQLIHFPSIIVNSRIQIFTDAKLRKVSKFAKFALFFFWHIFSQIPSKNFPKEIRLKTFQQEIRAILTEILGHENSFNTVVYGSTETHVIMHNLKTYHCNQLNIGNKRFFSLPISFDSCHNSMLLESLNIFSFQS